MIREIFKKNNEKGFIIIVVIMILAFLMATGLIFYRSSMQTTSNIYYRSDFLKARNLARGGFEKALEWVYEHYKKGEDGDTVTLTKHNASFLSGTLASGKYGVSSIKIVKKLNVDDKKIIAQKYESLPYVIEDRSLGKYDLLRIDTYGISNDIKVEQSTIVKIIVGEVKY